MRICKTAEKMKGKNEQRGERKIINDLMFQLAGTGMMMMRSTADTVEKMKGGSRKGEIMTGITIRMQLKSDQKAEIIMTTEEAQEANTARRMREITGGGPSLIGTAGRIGTGGMITMRRRAETMMMKMHIGKESIGGEHMCWVVDLIKREQFCSRGKICVQLPTDYLLTLSLKYDFKCGGLHPR